MQRAFLMRTAIDDSIPACSGDAPKDLSRPAFARRQGQGDKSEAPQAPRGPCKGARTDVQRLARGSGDPTLKDRVKASKRSERSAGDVAVAAERSRRAGWIRVEPAGCRTGHSEIWPAPEEELEDQDRIGQAHGAVVVRIGGLRAARG
jgi:hypothetical protein